MGFLSDPGINGKPLEGVRKVINDCIVGKVTKKKKGRGWKYGSVRKSTGCPCRGPRFRS